MYGFLSNHRWPWSIARLLTNLWMSRTVPTSLLPSAPTKKIPLSLSPSLPPVQSFIYYLWIYFSHNRDGILGQNMFMFEHVYPFRVVKYRTVLSLNFSPLCHLTLPLLRVCFAFYLICLQQSKFQHCSCDPSLCVWRSSPQLDKNRDKLSSVLSLSLAFMATTHSHFFVLHCIKCFYYSSRLAYRSKAIMETTVTWDAHVTTSSHRGKF